MQLDNYMNIGISVFISLFLVFGTYYLWNAEPTNEKNLCDNMNGTYLTASRVCINPDAIIFRE